MVVEVNLLLDDDEPDIVLEALIVLRVDVAICRVAQAGPGFANQKSVVANLKYSPTSCNWTWSIYAVFGAASL